MTRPSLATIASDALDRLSADVELLLIPRPFARLTLRLPFKRWSQAVDRNGLEAARLYLKSTEARLERSALEQQWDVLNRDLFLYGTAFVRGGKRVAPEDVYVMPPYAENRYRDVTADLPNE